jgi:hypothetical protein
LKSEKSPYYLEYCLLCQEYSLIYRHNISIQSIAKAAKANLKFLNKEIQKLAIAHEKYIAKKPVKRPKTVISKAKTSKVSPKARQA